MTGNDNNARVIALITGANRGIGRAIVEQLAQRDITVLLGSRDPERGAETARALQDAGYDAHPVTLDVTRPDTILAVAKAIDQAYGRLDILVNNAGIAGNSRLLKPSEADIDLVREVFETNFFGVIAVTNAMLPLLRRSAAARIVNMSSHVGSLATMTDPNHYMSQRRAQAAYPTSKTALNALTVQYAKELKPEGILVNAAAPGGCATDFTKGANLTRTAADGAVIVVRLATLGPDGPTGGYFDDDGPVRW
jgi:NAD(P)-dependent dehydrogenase (short-subunit alcohol dehydrogenase family)